MERNMKQTEGQLTHRTKHKSEKQNTQHTNKQAIETNKHTDDETHK